MTPPVAPTPTRGPATRVALVTGGTGGIGRAVAVRLAQAGDRVLVTGRDPDRGAHALAELRHLGPAAEHAFLPADLALLAGTAGLAAAVAQHTDRLDALVCCAGVLATRPAWTAEGLEHALALNYLSRHLLARLLLPLLARSTSGRLVLVANAGRYRDTLDLDDLQHRRGRPGLAVAGRTQFANDLLAVELGERWRDTGVEVSCVFPGLVRTALFAHATGLPRAVRVLAPAAVALLGSTPATAADTPAWLARDPQAAGTNGSFFGPHRRRIPVPPRAQDPTRRRELWEASDALVRQHLTVGPAAGRSAGGERSLPTAGQG